MYKIIKEGDIYINVPDVRIPEEGKNIGFYNPRMKTDRDISIAILASFIKRFNIKNPIILDLMAASGVRGLRYKKEIGGDVTLNDISESAFNLIKRNAEMNSLNVKIFNKDARLLALTLKKDNVKFDFIDIDPFGSPKGFIEYCIPLTKDITLFSITATDTPVLFGLYPEACLKRYGFRVEKLYFYREVGTRVLLSFVIKKFEENNKSIAPLLCYSTAHYVKLFFISSEELSSKQLKNFESLEKYEDWIRLNEEDVLEKIKNIGKIYLGNLCNKDFCNDVLEEIRLRNLDGAKILNLAINEIEIPFYYDIHYIAKRFKIHEIPKSTEILDNLRKSGFLASRTVFCERGIKTNAKARELIYFMKK
ncbi:MAG: hypothetical protein QXJ96_01340 [Candidatus Aenigmatarchaeota archaeon]|nr:hypothetical protein [Candidatus Aenigmarchaeota archaeon]